MPQGSAEAKGASRPQDGTEYDDGGCKYSRGGSSRGDAKDAKRDSDAGDAWMADPKHGQQLGGGRGRILSSLSKQTPNTCTSEIPAFSSLPSPSADSGKLAPLDIGQRSPRSQPTPRVSIPSNNPKSRKDQPPERTNLSSPISGSNSPRSSSPRLPPMKTAPSPANDDSSLPALGLSPRKGAHSARRVRSLSPNLKRSSCADPAAAAASLEFAFPERATGGVGVGGGGGHFSPLLDAKEKDPSRRGLRDTAADNGGGSNSSSRQRDRGSERGGCEGGPRPSHLREGEIKAEAKSNGAHNGRHDGRLPGTKSTSPTHDSRGDDSRRRSSGRLPGTPTSLSPSPTNGRFKTSSRPSSMDDVAGATRRSSRREEQDMHALVASSSSSNGDNGNSTGNGRDHDAFPIGDDRVDGHRYQLNGGEEKDGGGNTPNSPSIGRGQESSKSPRTRRMRPQRDSAT